MKKIVLYAFCMFSFFGIAQVVPVLSDYVICDDDNDGIMIFDLTIKDAEVINGQSGMVVSYHLTAADADVGLNAISGLYSNSFNPETIYVRLTETATGNFDTGSFELVVNDRPIDPSIAVTPLTLCDDLGQVNNGMTSFDLTVKNSEIAQGNSDVSIKYYPSVVDATANTNIIPDPANYTNITNPQVIGVRVVDVITGCTEVTSFTIQVNQNPTPNNNLSDIVLCDGTNDGTSVFDLTGEEALILSTDANSSIDGYFESEMDAINNNLLIATPSSYTNISNPQTIWVRASKPSGCFEIVSFQIREYCPIGDDNILIESISETCVNMNNGQIMITAQEIHDYTVNATLNGTPITLPNNTFTESLTIENLTPGTYFICVNAAAVNYSQCFELNVDQVQTLQGSSNLTNQTYELNLTGATYYEITINDEVYTETAINANETVTFSTSLTNNSNDILVRTDKDCQGVFEEVITLMEQGIQLYPNPTSGITSLSFNGTNGGLLMISDLTGKLIFEQEIQPSEFIQIDMSKYTSGLYFVQVISANDRFTTKLIKH